MHAWILDPFPIGDRRLPHRSFPPRYVDVAELKQLGGVACFKVRFYIGICNSQS
jgi:hypothetical protein